MYRKTTAMAEMTANRKKTPCYYNLLFIRGFVTRDRNKTVKYRVMMQALRDVSHTVSVAYW